MALSKKKGAELLDRLSNGEDLRDVIDDMKFAPKDFTELVTSDLHSFVSACVPNLTELVRLHEKEQRTVKRMEKLHSRIEELNILRSESKPEPEE